MPRGLVDGELRRLRVEVLGLPLGAAYTLTGDGLANYLYGYTGNDALKGGAELVIQMDADFSHDPAYIPQLLRAIEVAALHGAERHGKQLVDVPRLHPGHRHDLPRLPDGPPDAEAAKMRVQVLSFGYKHGVPMDADLVFDVTLQAIGDDKE